MSLVEKDIKAGVLPARNLREAIAYIDDMLREE
jgi:hypothetical protein